MFISLSRCRWKGFIILRRTSFSQPLRNKSTPIWHASSCIKTKNNLVGLLCCSERWVDSNLPWKGRLVGIGSTGKFRVFRTKPRSDHELSLLLLLPCLSFQKDAIVLPQEATKVWDKWVFYHTVRRPLVNHGLRCEMMRNLRDSRVRCDNYRTVRRYMMNYCLRCEMIRNLCDSGVRCDNDRTVRRYMMNYCLRGEMIRNLRENSVSDDRVN
jgi:hypothetical protein